MSIVMTGANRHESPQIGVVLDGVMVNRLNTPQRINKHLCTDAGYIQAPALKTIEEHAYILQIKGRGQETDELKSDLTKKASRWLVEVAYNWFNRFCKLLVQYEKLDRSFIAPNHLAASIMEPRNIKLSVNTIYG